MYEKDYVKRIVKSIGQMLVAISMGRDAVESNIKDENYNIKISEDGLLEIMIKKYINEGKINEAEKMLMEAIKSRNSKRSYEIAVFFYDEINKWDDKKLVKCNFSHEKVVQGIENIKKLCEQKMN